MKVYLLFLAFFFSVMTSDASILVYPTPQHMQLSGGFTRVQEVQVVRANDEPAAGVISGGRYKLHITPGKLYVEVEDDDALYYAKQTLSQLLQGVPGAREAQRDPFPELSLEQVAKLGDLPLGSVCDGPDLPFRGVVEGYYGTPWSYAARLSIFEFMGRNKMNMYIYAPKDDPYHHGRGCYLPYPEEKAAEIRELVQHARRCHVRFVWAIHPANTVRWHENGGREQLEALCRKMQAMYELGVRDFAVFVDDSFGEIGKAERQAELSNYLMEHFIRQRPDVSQTLIMCPTGYNKSWASPRYLRELGEGLLPQIPIMWTGDTVVNDITLPGQRWVNELVKRPTFVWWNWPCSDFKAGRLSMGRAYGLETEPEMKSQMSGFVANPMEHAEASKVGLFGVADYTWNIAAYDSVRAWKEGVARLYPADREAMQLFCEHNSYLLPNTHGYFREESVSMAPVVQEFVRSMEEERPLPDAAEAIRAEFSRMEMAGKQLQESLALGALKQEIMPWLRQFVLLGQVGELAIDALREQGETQQLALFFDAMDLLAKMQTVQRNAWNNGSLEPVADVEVAAYAMTPVMHRAFQYVNGSIYARFAGRKYAVPHFITSVGDPHRDRSAISDGNPKTFWSSGRRQQAGDWFCLDFGSPIEIRRVCLLMGGMRPTDYAAEGQFEVSDNGRDWAPLGSVRRGPAASLNVAHAPARARMVRFRITEPRQNCLSIREFSVNSVLPPSVSSNLAEQPRLTAAEHDDAVGVNRVMEVLTMQPGEYIDLEIPAFVIPSWVEINLENADLMKWGRLEFTLADGSRRVLNGEMNRTRFFAEDGMPQQAISSLRLTHVGDSPQEIKLTLFRVGVSERSVYQTQERLMDNDLSTAVDCSEAALDVELPLAEGASEAIVVGTAECEIENAECTARTPHTRHFTVPADSRSLHIKAPMQSGKFISEIIFK